jgi:hypothetical protein
VVPPGVVAREVVADAAADGKSDEVALGAPKAKPTVPGVEPAGLLVVPNKVESGAAGLFSPLAVPNRFESGFDVDPGVLLRLLKILEGLPVLVGVAAVTLTVGVGSWPSLLGVGLPNLIGLSGFQVLSLGAAVLLLNTLFISPKGLAVFGCVFSFSFSSSSKVRRTTFPLLSLVILSKSPPVKPPIGVLVPEGEGLVTLVILSKSPPVNWPVGVLVPESGALPNLEANGLVFFAEARPGPVSSAGVPGPLALSPSG